MAKCVSRARLKLMTMTATTSKPTAQEALRDVLIATQKVELDRLRRHNKRLRLEQQRPRVSAPAKPAFELTSPLRKPREGEKVLAPLTPPITLARQMGKAIAAELRAMTIEARHLVHTLSVESSPVEQGAMDALPDDAQRKLEQLRLRYEKRFAALGEQMAKRMIAGVVSNSSAQLNIGLREMAERMEIHATLSSPRMRAVVESSAQACVGLIKRIPEKYLGEVQTAVMSVITTGSGLNRLVPYLTKRYKGDVRHAHLVALDQVRKVSASVNAARLQALGVEEYVWIHVGGERYPRELHMKYNGRRFRYDDPPIIDKHTGERGKPGDLINCRCMARPVLQFTKMQERGA